MPTNIYVILPEGKGLQYIETLPIEPKYGDNYLKQLAAITKDRYVSGPVGCSPEEAEMN